MTRQGLRVLAAAAVVLATVISSAEVASASCAGPRVSISNGFVAPGGTVNVSGTGFGTDCHDTGQGGPPLGAPDRRIAVVFVQGAARIALGEVRAGGDYRVEFTVTIPVRVGPGRAALEVGSARTELTVEGDPVSPDGLATKPVHQFPRVVPRATEASNSQFWVGGLLGVGLGVGLVEAWSKFRQR